MTTGTAFLAGELDPTLVHFGKPYATADAQLDDQSLQALLAFEDLPWAWALAGMGEKAFPGLNRTLHYQPKGTDTLSIGDARCWIEGRYKSSLMQRYPRPGVMQRHTMDYVLVMHVIEGQCLREPQSRQRLNGLYAMRNEPAVQELLQSNPLLLEVLNQAVHYLRKYFGPESHVSLEVVSDPETVGHEELFAYIHTDLPVDDALDQLDRLDEEWFLDQLDSIGGLFNFNLEFA